MTTARRTIHAKARRRGLSVTRPPKSIAMSLLMVLFLVYALGPIAWLLISATKTQSDLFNTFGLSFGHS
ncbi:MAG: hypothetical protein FWF28_08240, partial [Micrococcales bacterium]|nr:hypothetical protein [Micrococcales bacterium]